MSDENDLSGKVSLDTTDYKAGVTDLKSPDPGDRVQDSGRLQLQWVTGIRPRTD